ncbi:MAG: hypothetical protein RM022_022840 [Nostoc sp. EfeVER01]|uniref:hypothetical protein n=1 Tax=Nostoc sp. EfeVER01 TaxID=3075406 RepID=UPI00391887F8
MKRPPKTSYSVYTSGICKGFKLSRPNKLSLRAKRSNRIIPYFLRSLRRSSSLRDALANAMTGFRSDPTILVDDETKY